MKDYLKRQTEAVLMISRSEQVAHFNQLCRRLLALRPIGETWFALKCTPTQESVDEVPYLRVELDRLEEFPVHHRALSERLIEAMEAEQERLSREVHDGMLQCIIGSRMLLDGLVAKTSRQNPDFKVLIDIEECLAQANLEGRRLLENLRPAAIDELGMVEASTLFLERMQREHGQTFEFENQMESGDDFPPEIRRNMYRVLQEAVYNAVQHSGSSRVKVSVGRVEDEAWVRVEDWGVGFELAKVFEQKDTTHIGLYSLRERASLLGGHCKIVSGPSEGTAVEVRVPIGETSESGFSNLRARAQAILQRRPSDLGEEALAAKLGPDEVAALLHEFEVQRMELEVQNNELRLSQAELMTSRDRFRSLYEHTALGYLETDMEGRLVSANLTLSSMLGRPRYDLVGRSLDSLLLPEFRLKTSRPGFREVKMLAQTESGWFWAKLESRRISKKRLQVSVEDLTFQRLAAKEKAQMELHLNLTRKKKDLDFKVDEVLADLLSSLGDICTSAISRDEPASGELLQELEALLGRVTTSGDQSLRARNSGTITNFQAEACLEETLSALSLTRDLARVDWSLEAGSAEIAGDSFLFGILVEKLILLAESSLDEGEGRITVRLGVVDVEGDERLSLEVADSMGARDWLRGKAQVGAVSFQLDKLAQGFGTRISSLYEPGRGTTARLLFPLSGQA